MKTTQFANTLKNIAKLISIEAKVINKNIFKFIGMGLNINNIQDIRCVKIPAYIKYPIADVTVLYLLTIVVDIVIRKAPNKTKKKYILKLSKPGWITNKTPINPKNKEIIIYVFNFSFKKNIANNVAIKGEDIFKVVYSGRVIFFKAMNANKGMGANIIPLTNGIQ